MEEIIFCRGGGCTAKLGAGVLERILLKLPTNTDPDLLVGIDSKDDGAVYKINDHQAIISTLDFFPPVVEDPYLYGAIAAANALSDIYAMGGEVKTALNIVCFPEQMDMNTLGKILQGGSDKVIEAGGSLCGGHSIADEEIKYGLSVTGIVDPKKIYRNNGCRNGDALILTKKLGVGILMTAHRIHMDSEEAFHEAVSSMSFLNKYAADVLKDYEVHACTDVTGFGFLAHLLEMLDGMHSAVIESERIPYFGECDQYVEEFYLTAAAQKNRNHVGDQVQFEDSDFVMEEILFDPQTSGGLLVSVKQEDANEIVQKMRAQQIPAQVVGYITEKQEKAILVKGRKKE
ncbi:MAG: selenide, water dikinase SelD [Fusicatenibacter sp.]|nr:selenide, water dikinase SelD [Fusicatenibacter sp.]